MPSPIKEVYGNFIDQREKRLTERFPGLYRAVITETNDPLDMHRVRVKCPELHDSNLPDNKCPWATVCCTLGTNRNGSWVGACKGDYVWIGFERGHPYSPIVLGFAAPTRRQNYPLASIYTETPVPVNSKGDIQDESPDDYNSEYLPADRRPMSHGIMDRYGHLDIFSSVGFFPTEHKGQPLSAGHDAQQASDFTQQASKPGVNAPDVKHITRISKYGHMFTQSDQGYHWLKETDTGEFTGDTEKDSEFEIDRWKYLQRLINEDSINGDSRKQKLMNRYGSFIEMRDTGWAQPGPMPSKSRDGEYGPRVYLSKEESLDHRWIKIRTKGGFLLQAIDVGLDPEEDEFIKRPLIDEVGGKLDGEDEHWAGRDARMWRMASRHGFKIVISDAGSDTKMSHALESPHGTGILLKGRRTGGDATGDERGFQFEINERDEVNHMILASPLGMVHEISDRHQYQLMCTRLNEFTPKWMNLKDNEFFTESAIDRDPISTTHHLFLDHVNEMIRLKSRGGAGSGPFNTADKSQATFQQGLEIHDGGDDGPWVEIVDTDRRGLWLSNKNNIGIWRGASSNSMAMWIDDANRQIVVRNPSGTTLMFGRDGVTITSSQQVLIAAPELKFKADRNVTLQGGGGIMEISSSAIKHSVPLVFAASSPITDRVTVPSPSRSEPSDRGARG